MIYQQVRKIVIKMFSIDIRSLAIFRIFLALLLIINLIIRFTNLTAHYTDKGVLPLEAIKSFKPWYLSIFSLSDNHWFLVSLFFLGILFAIMMLIGYHSKIATIVIWYFFFSIHIRNPYILQGGDSFIQLLLFFCVFLPLGGDLSVDKYLSGKLQKEKSVFSVATIGILLQAPLMYLSTAILKSRSEIWQDGTAIYYALNLDAYATAFGKYLLGFPHLIKILSFAVPIFEFVGPFILLISAFSFSFRILMIFIFILLQLSFGLSLRLDLFPWQASVAMILYLPNGFWDKFAITKLLKFNIKPKILIKKKSYNKVKNFKKIFRNIKLNYVINMIVIFILFLSIFGNLLTTNLYNMPMGLYLVGWNLQLFERWSMFTNEKSQFDGWLVVPGTLNDGTTLNMLTKGNLSWDKPELISSTFKDSYWKRYYYQFYYYNQKYRNYFAKYICYEWNRQNTGEKRLKELEIYFMNEKTLPNYQKPEIKKNSYGKYKCNET